MPYLFHFLKAIGAPETVSLPDLWPDTQLSTVVLSYRNHFPDAPLSDELVRGALLELAQRYANDPTKTDQLLPAHWAELQSHGVRRREQECAPPSILV